MLHFFTVILENRKMKSFAFLILCIAPLWASPLEGVLSEKKVPLADVSERIINGQTASKGQFPWQAAVISTKSGGNSFCGGSIISNLWILTAAHCATGASSFTLHLGTNSLTPDTGALTVTTTTGIVHPNYNPSSLVNDIALIRLNSAITFSTYIQAIPLSSSSLGSGVAVTVSGWGKIRDSSTGVSNTLNYVGLTSISNNDCSTYYGSLSSGVVCASGTNSRSTCNGDSGGPLVRGSGSSAVQEAIVSFVSSRGCESGYPSGYVRVSYYRDWIRQQTGI